MLENRRDPDIQVRVPRDKKHQIVEPRALQPAGFESSYPTAPCQQVLTVGAARRRRTSVEEDVIHTRAATEGRPYNVFPFAHRSPNFTT